jgi:tRNA_anti-like
MKRKTISIFIIIIFIVAFGIYAGIRMYNKPHINVAETAPDNSFLSQNLVAEFENNETQANSKYLEKVIKVSGEISELGTSNGTGTIVLKSENSISNVMCYLTAEETKKWSTLKKGENIAVKGICTGFLMDVVLINCVLVK